MTIARDDMKGNEYRGLLCVPRVCIRRTETLFRDPRKTQPADTQQEQPHE